MGGPGVGSTSSTCKKSGIKPAEKNQDPSLHWIKFVIVDEAGKPVPDLLLEVIFTDGSAIMKNSDKNGIVEIRNIDPGTYKLDTDWEYTSIDYVVLIQ